jgi:BirA family biotin operon repressor/biotin-[acetyl-CoA-carboxylase] ligase
MYETLFIGNELIMLESIDSTNLYIKQLVSNKMRSIEGLVVIAKNQQSGRGQMGNKWISEIGKNLTFSILLKPKISISHQFLLTKVISLGIVDFLLDEKMKDIKIKWPNDIYVRDDKIAGILIENTIKGTEIDSCIVGIGLNVNQILFDKGLTNATSMKKEKEIDYDLDDVLKRLLFFIEKRYLMLKALNFTCLDADYLSHFYQFNKLKKYEILGEIIDAKITGVSNLGKLKLAINNSINEYDLKEVRFI